MNCHAQSIVSNMKGGVCLVAIFCALRVFGDANTDTIFIKECNETVPVDLGKCFTTRNSRLTLTVQLNCSP